MGSYEKKATDKQFPYTIREMKGVAHNKIVSDFRSLSDGLVQVGPERWLLRPGFQNFAEQIYNFESRPDDVFICTLPRSGTTWTQEMMWLICNNLNYDAAKKTGINDRFPYLE